MPTLHVCSLARLHETVARTGARQVVTLINAATVVERPAVIDGARHLFLGINDIVEPIEGGVLPAAEHVDRLLAFARDWDRAEPLVVHCYAGVSRSTAAAYIIACALAPERDEAAIARSLRDASAHATPNRLLVALADERLGRGGRMVAAVEAIGRGADCAEGEPFALALA